MARAKKAPAGTDEGPVGNLGRKKLTGAMAKSLASRARLDRIQMNQPPSSKEVDHLRQVLTAHPEARLRLFGMHHLPELDLTPLGNLPELRALSVENDLGDIGFLEGMGGLEALNLGIKGKRTALSPIASLPKLRRLGISGKLKSLEPIAGARSLEQLSVSVKEALDLSPLADLPNLRSLSVEAKGTLDLGPLVELPSLEALGIDCPRVASFDPLAEMEHLKKLGLGVAKATSDELRPIGRSSVQALSLAYMPKVTDLDFLAGAKRLGALKLLSLGGLKNVEQLPRLNLWTLAISLQANLDSGAVDQLAACESIEFAIVAPNFFASAGREDECDAFQQRWHREGLNFASWSELVDERIGLAQ